MKNTFLLFTTLLILSIQSHAQQMVISSGAHVVSGTHLVLNSDSLVNRGTMRIKPEGVVHLTGNLNNHGTMTHEKGSGVVLYGSAPQVIGGSNPVIFSTLNLNNSTGFTLAKDATVNGNLQFLNGMISTGANLLTIGDTGTITNAAAVRYVDGKLARTFSGIGTKAFPIGKGGNYRPVTLQFSELTGTSQVTAEQFETGLTGTLPADVTLMTTNRYWTLTQSGGSDMQYLVTLDATGYTPERPVVILKKDAGVIASHEATTPDYTNATALTTFSDFGLGEECVNPTDGGTIEGEQTICADDSPTEISGDIPPDFIGTLEYKWQVSTTSSAEGFSDVAGTDSQDYTPTSVTQTSWFKRLARVDCKTDWTGAAESNVVKITVNPASVGGTLAGTTSVCYETNSTLLSLSGYEGSILRWEYTLNNWTTPHTITTTSATYTATNLTDTTKYRAVVKRGDCDEVYSSVATITVYDDFNPGAILASGETIWKGDDAAEIGSSAAASGGDESYTYLWQSSLTETFTSPVDLTGSNATSYNPGTLDATTWFRRTVKDGTCNTTPETSAGVWKVTVNDPVFQDDLFNKSMTWDGALTIAGSSGADTITLLKDYTQAADAIINHDIYFDLNGHTFEGGKVNTIASSKRFGFLNSLTTGTFDNEVRFDDATSTLTLFDNFTPGALFTTANSTNDGVLQLGNYFDTFEFSLTTTNEALFTKVHTINPRTNVTLKMNGGLTTTAYIQLDDGAVAKLGAGTFTQDFASTMPTSSTANIQVGDSAAAVVTITGDFSNYGGTLSFFDGSTLNMDLVSASYNFFTTTIGGITTATTLIKKGGAFTIGNPSANHGIRLEPYGILDLANASNAGDLMVFGNILISDYDHLNTGEIKFLFTKAEGAISTNGLSSLGGKILTNDPADNQIDVSRHFVFDMNNLTGNISQTYQIPFATTFGTCSTTGTPVPLNAEGWGDFSVSTVPSAESGYYNLVLNATYTGCINPTSGGTLTENQEGCGSFDPAEISGTLPTGHTGTPEYKWQKSETSAIAGFDDIETSNSQNYNPGTIDTTTWFKRLARVDCKSGWSGAAESNVVEMTVEQTPVSGTLAKSPDQITVCEGSNVSATLTSGIGGSGIDSTYYRTKATSIWSSWTAYTNAANISTSGKTDVEIRTKRKGTECSDASWTTVSWTIEQTPVSGTLAKTPDQTTVCEGSNVSATLTAGAGGNLTDSTYSRTKASGSWSSWTAYNSAANISTTGKTEVEVRTKRKGTECSDASWTTVSWSVEPTPVSGTLAKSPDQATVCEGSNVSATLTAGIGGSGTDSTYYRTKATSVWSSWTAYTSAANVSTSGKTDIEIRTKRKGTECSDATWNTITWNIEPTPVSGTLAKSPDQATVCEGSNVSATLTAGVGGSGTDSTYYRKKDSGEWSPWNAYTNATNITTAGKTDVDIRTKRKGTECSDASWTTVSWSVEKTPVSGTLAKLPDQATVCEGSNVSATLTSGTGGSGTDSTYYRTKATSVWSSWTAYTSAASISTAGKTDVEIRTKRKADACTDASWTTVHWNVDPSTAGGSISGGTTYCTDINSTLLTLTGHTGNVQKWQSADNSFNWSDIASVTTTTYTATNVSSDTWYRVIVKSGLCQEKASDSALISIGNNVAISGYAKYDNNPKTPLNGIKILLSKDNMLTDSTITTLAGYYEFDSLQSGNYALHIKSAHPSGQWQTWSGVNNTDYLLVNKHVAGTLLLPVNPPVIRTSASVKLLHPLINTLDAITIRQASKFPLTGYNYFDTAKWVFSGLDAAHELTGITLDCDNVTRDIMGLCTGDVNGTYVPPTGVKTLHATSLQLEHRGNLPLTDEILFPIRVERDMELGAITLMLDYDPSQIEITGVTMPENGGVEPWFEVQNSKFKVAATLNLEPETLNFEPETLNFEPETLNLLQIGWMSMEPVRVKEGETLLLIHTRLTEAFRISHLTSQISHSTSEISNLKSEMQNAKSELRNLKSEIRFALTDNPLSELADGDGSVISGVTLTMPTGKNGEMAKRRNGEIVCYPNPVKDVLNVEFVTDNVDGKTWYGMSLQLVTMHGVVVAKQTVADIKTGMNKTTMDLRDLPNGAYLLKVYFEDLVEVRKVIINR